MGGSFKIGRFSGIDVRVHWTFLLLLAFFAFQSLPINFAGVLLILFAIVLFIAEVKVVSHGVLAVGGASIPIDGGMLRSA